MEKQLKDFFEPKRPLEKPVYTKKQMDWAISFLNTPSQRSQNLDSDYLRELKKQSLNEMEKRAVLNPKPAEMQKKSGKDVPMLGKQKKQSIDPLIVQRDIDREFKALVYADIELMDQRAINGAQQMGISVLKAREHAREMSMTLGKFLGYEEADTTPAPQYRSGKPLVSREEHKFLPTHMRSLHKWYMGMKGAKEWICALVKEEHHFKEYLMYIEMIELFQLFNLRALDKSILGIYCL